MRIGGRTLGTILSAAFQPRHYRAALNMARVYASPTDGVLRYLFNTGSYPTTLRVNTPLGEIGLRADSRDDVLTVNEVFCRTDYRANASDQVVVDFGSNIGVSAAYFLTHAPKSHVWLFEPLERNVVRLRENLRQLENRYSLTQAAVALTDGTARFGWEDTGRYGGIGRPTGRYVEVPTVDANRVLRMIIQQHGHIDILKIDIEAMEEEIVSGLCGDVLDKVRCLYVEHRFRFNPIASTHCLSQRGSIARFVFRGSRNAKAV